MLHDNFWTGSGSCFDLKLGSPMFRMFRKPVSVLDEKSNKTIMWFRITFQIHLKEMCPRSKVYYWILYVLESSLLHLLIFSIDDKLPIRQFIRFKFATNLKVGTNQYLILIWRPYAQGKTSWHKGLPVGKNNIYIWLPWIIS